MTFMYALGRAILCPFIWLYSPFKFINRDRIPKDGKLVICCNHISNLDPIILSVCANRQVNYMAKEELFKNKFASKILKSVGAFPVARGKGDANAVNSSLELLNTNQVLGIFIEGTRSKTGELLKPKPGAVIFASDANAPILPVSISTSTKTGLIKPFCKVIVNFGNVIQPQELGIVNKTGSEYRNASRYVMQKISDLRDEGKAVLNK